MPNRESPFKRLSLKSRLLLAATLWLSAMILAAGYIIPNLIKEYLVSDVQNQLQLSMDEITANLGASDSGALNLNIRLSDPRFYQPYSGLYWTARVGDQELRSRSLWDRELTRNDHPLKPTYQGAKDEPLIVLTRTVYLPEFSNPVTILVGIDEAPIMTTFKQVVGQLWMILGLLFIGILALISAQISWSLWPLGKMQKELVSLRKGDQAGLSGAYPKEISPLVNDLNALLFHYQELLERARNHAGNLSHALKTPLSVIKNEVNVLPPDQRESLRRPIEQIQKQIDYHLGRARMAGSANILAVKTHPSERVDAITMAFDKVYTERGVMVVNELDSELEVAVDTTDFDEMIGNLLENSYKWANTLVRIHSRIVDKKWIEICVEDDGPGIDKADLTDAVKRGVRLDETQPGSGLGLNIVSEMAHSYQGKLTLARSTLGGLNAILTLKQPTR